MKIERFSQQAQDGLRNWARDVHGDEMVVDGLGFIDWCATYFELRISRDNPAWFPKGRSATLQLLEQWLLEEAKDEVPQEHRQ